MLRQILNRGHSGGLQLLLAEIHWRVGMPFADRSFDRVLTSFFYGLLPLEDRGRFLEEARRVGDELIVVEPTPEWGTGNGVEGWEERALNDGARYEIYRRYFTAEALAEELDGRILFAGRWMVMTTVGR